MTTLAELQKQARAAEKRKDWKEAAILWGRSMNLLRCNQEFVSRENYVKETNKMMRSAQRCCEKSLERK